MRRCAIAICMMAALAWPAVLVAGQGRQDDVRLDAPSPLAGAREIARRTQTPTTFDRMQRYVSGSGRQLAEQTVDIAQARFDVGMRLVKDHRPGIGRPRCLQDAVALGHPEANAIRARNNRVRDALWIVRAYEAAHFREPTAPM